MSVPITWDELDDPDLRPDRWNLRNVGARLAEAGDPLAPWSGSSSTFLRSDRAPASSLWVQSGQAPEISRPLPGLPTRGIFSSIPSASRGHMASKGASVTDQLRVEVRPNGDIVTFRLAGEVDIASIGTLRCCLDDVDSAWRVVVIDAADLTFIDSTGIAALAGAHFAPASGWAGAPNRERGPSGPSCARADRHDRGVHRRARPTVGAPGGRRGLRATHGPDRAIGLKQTAAGPAI